jgi:hypothetical protein
LLPILTCLITDILAPMRAAKPRTDSELPKVRESITLTFEPRAERVFVPLPMLKPLLQRVKLRSEHAEPPNEESYSETRPPKRAAERTLIDEDRITR